MTVHFNIARLRTREIAALVRHRHGRLPDTDDKVIYLDVARDHLDPPHGDIAFALQNWARQCGATLTEAELQDIIGKPAARMKADVLGKALRLTKAERAACGIRTIGATDCDKRQRTALRKQARKAREAARRLAQGATPREQSLSRTRPWQAEGISRRTWERRRRNPKANHHANNTRRMHHASETHSPTTAPIRRKPTAAAPHRRRVSQVRGHETERGLATNLRHG